MATDINERAKAAEEQLLTALSTAAQIYNGVRHGGTDQNGIVDIEFPTLLQAAEFIDTTNLGSYALMRDPMPTGAMRTFNEPITIQVPLLAYAMCR